MDKEKIIDRLIEEDEIASLLKGLDDDLEVPFDAAMSWRKLIKSEAKKRRLFGRMRWACEIAATIALVIGATFIWRGLNSSAVPAESQSSLTADKASFVYYTANDSSAKIAAVFAYDSSMDSGLSETEDAEAAFAAAAMKTGGVLPANGTNDVEADLIVTDNEVMQDTEESFEEDLIDASGSADEEENRFAYFALADVVTDDVHKAGETLRGIVSEFDAFVETEWLPRTNAGVTSASGTIRVRKDELSEFTQRLQNAFENCSIRIETREIDLSSRDLTSQRDSAYLRLDELRDKLSNSTDTEEINLLNTQIQQIYDELYEYEDKLRSSRSDLEYATVYYAISTESIPAAAPAPKNGSGFAGFLKDVLKALCIVLPTALISAVLTLHLTSVRRKKNRA